MGSIDESPTISQNTWILKWFSLIYTLTFNNMVTSNTFFTHHFYSMIEIFLMNSESRDFFLPKIGCISARQQGYRYCRRDFPSWCTCLFLVTNFSVILNFCKVSISHFLDKFYGRSQQIHPPILLEEQQANESIFHHWCVLNTLLVLQP